MKLTSLLAATALTLVAGTTFAQTKLTLGHGAAPGNPRHEAAVAFANAVKQKSGGSIEVQVAPSAQLGDDAAMLTALRIGALDMSANSQGAIADCRARVRRLRHALPVHGRRRRPSSCSTVRSARNSPTSPRPRTWSCSATGTTASAT